jgi:hypothetical protein
MWVSVDSDLFPDPDNPPAYIAVAYQVPENLMYGTIVKYDGVTVYQNEAEVPKLIKTVFKEITASVFKIKVIFVDCEDRPLSNTPAWMVDPVLGTEVRFNTGVDGARDFVLAGQDLKFTKLYWKGVNVPLLEAKLPDGTVIKAAADGSITIPLSADIRAPIRVKVLVEDIVFKTWDFQGTVAIPRLNITVWWTGYNISDPKKETWYFLETMDPVGYAVRDDSLAERLGIDTPFDYMPWNTSVRVAQFFSYVIYYDNRTNAYTFYQMPPALYNIVVTTVLPREGISDSASPGIGFWPGEDQDRAYESRITWKPSGESVTPTEDHAGANTRVVLREFNKDLRFKVCGALNVDLKTWAHEWNLEMIDGDRKIGDVSFTIINDNFQEMASNSTEWEKLTLKYYTAIYGDNTRGVQDWSFIWWNGSYRLQDVRLETNMSFTVDKFYNASAEPNKVYEYLNFTIQPSEALHKQQTTYKDWLDLQTDFGYKIIIYEKETLRAPLPVTFIKPRAIDKGGAPLQGALIEAWILDLDKASKIDITEESGEDEIYGYTISWQWEKKTVADRDTPQHFKEVTWDRLWLSCSGGGELATVLLQVPPYPAKLYLRNFDGCPLDLAVSAKEIYVLVDSRIERDNNVGADTKMATPDGLLKYAQWKTNAKGEIDSFTVPGYEGLLLVPTSGWLNETFSYEGYTGEDLPMEEEFHYLFNVVWKSAGRLQREPRPR